MASPFDITKSLTQTKDNLFTTDELFNREYVPFMINRILLNSPSTALFADVMNRYGMLDKKLQYDFYRLGIPKSKAFTKWVKKEESDIPQEHLDFISEQMGVSLVRAIELYGLIGADAVQKQISSRGGKK
jgi:hypothetical protein